MKKFNIIKVLIWTIIISALYAAFQHYFFDMSVILPLFVSLIVLIIFVTKVKLSKPKMIICGLLIGITMYCTFIAVGYQLMRMEIKNHIPANITFNCSTKEFVDTLIYSETGHKGIAGYMIMRTHTESIHSGYRVKNSRVEGIGKEIWRFLVMTFFPLLSQLEPKNNKWSRKEIY